MDATTRPPDDREPKVGPRVPGPAASRPRTGTISHDLVGHQVPMAAPQPHAAALPGPPSTLPRPPPAGQPQPSARPPAPEPGPHSPDQGAGRSTSPRPWQDQDFVRPRRSISLLGSGQRRLREDQRNTRIITRAPQGGRVIAVVSAKGGVGKTTTTRMLGEVLALRRGDRVVAVDCNHDTGSLAMRLPEISTNATVADLVRDARHLRRYSDVQAYVSECPSRLSVLGSSLDPDVNRGLGVEEYRTALAVLAYHWSVVLCDLGTGLTDPPTTALLRRSDQYVVVTGPQLDEAKVAVSTLDWLGRYFAGRAVRAVAVINDRVGRGRIDVHTNRIEEYFRSRCRAVVRVPWDRELATGGAPRWERLGHSTREAYLDLAAVVAEDFLTGAAAADIAEERAPEATG